MTAEESKAIFEQVKANAKALAACKGPHEFEDITPEHPLAKRYRCRLCGGEASASNVIWYRRGVEHGKSSGP